MLSMITLLPGVHGQLSIFDYWGACKLTATARVMILLLSVYFVMTRF